MGAAMPGRHCAARKALAEVQKVIPVTPGSLWTLLGTSAWGSLG